MAVSNSQFLRTIFPEFSEWLLSNRPGVSETTEFPTLCKFQEFILSDG